jgi:hypothetical protein
MDMGLLVTNKGKSQANQEKQVILSFNKCLQKTVARFKTDTRTDRE